MQIDDYLKSDSDWLKKDDVNYKGLNVTITAVTEETVGQEKERKLALHFRGDIKPMLLNKVNLKVLAAMFGTDTKDWMGEQVNVYNDPAVNFNGATGGLRLRPATAERKQPDIADRYAKEAMADARTTRVDTGHPSGPRDVQFDDAADIPF
jgi:hypothetical protein